MMSRYFTSIFLLLLFSSCANYKLNYSKEAKDWKTKNIAPTDQVVKHRMYLIGELGGLRPDKPSPTLELLQKKLEGSGKNSSVVFLGGNVSPKGLARKSKKEARKLAEFQLDSQLDILKDYEGRIIFLPGRTDWKKYGLKGLRRQEKYLEKRLNKGIEEEDDWEEHFFPGNGCSGPEVVEINDQLVVVVVDSQWYLGDWDAEPEINDGCEIKTRKDFAFHFEEVVRKYRNKNVVVAMHHPVYSYGPRGGLFTAKDHLFPFTMWKKNLYIPVPVLGSLAAFYRTTVGLEGDLSNIKYQEFIDAIMAGATKNGSYIFAGAHEKNMQYIFEERQHFIVSGTGTQTSSSSASTGSDFAYANPGFAQIDFYEDGAAWLQFWSIDKDGKEQLVFRKQIKDKLEISKDNIPESFPEYDQKLESKTTTVVTNKVTEKSNWHYFWLGEHFRPIYSQTYKFPVLDLATFKGGMSPVKRGGGNQTNSLRLIDPNGQQYVMRALTKDASRTVPYPINKMTAANSIVQETFLSSHPFAALAVPPMANAVNVYHTNPQLYYIPKQPVLGIHNDLFGGQVYLVEERAGGNWKKEASLGNSKKLISTGDMSRKITRSHKHTVDQRWLLRSRLFDQVIGDWDRHDDQWRWATIKINKDSTTYRAIPRDRDQPFSKYDGFLIQAARLFMPFLRQLKVFSPDIKNMKWSSWSPKYVDNSFLNEMDWPDWEAEAKFIQQNLTDEVIDKAFETWPEKAQELTAETIASIIKKRRDNLVKFARMHYELLYKRVDVYGTEKDEIFEITRLPNGDAHIKIFHKKKKSQPLVFDRVFQRSVTKEISIYGLGGEDAFNLSGEGRKGITLRLIGGLDEDTYVDKSKVSGLSKKTKIYDDKDDNNIELGSEARDRTSNDPYLNTYDRRAYHYEYDYTIPLPIVGFNPDDGFVIGLNTLTTTYRFKKSPYASIHTFNGNVAFATGGLDLNYLGDFTQLFGKWNLLLQATYRTDRFSFSYYGLGNETKLTTDDFNFNRVRQSMISIHPAFKKPINALGDGFTIGPIYERTSISQTPGRFIETDPIAESGEIFIDQAYGGIKTGLHILSLDNIQIPTKGSNLILDAAWMTDLGEVERDFALLNADFALYQKIDRKGALIFATRFGASHRIGNYPFFHSAILGGRTNLRGFRADRFYGNTSFFHNTDLRIRLLSSVNKILPFTMGILGGFDYGRVWLDGQDSDRWHTGYGGALWIAPVDFIVLNVGYFLNNDDDNRFTFKIGFDF